MVSNEIFSIVVFVMILIGFFFGSISRKFGKLGSLFDLVPVQPGVQAHENAFSRSVQVAPF